MKKIKHLKQGEEITIKGDKMIFSHLDPDGHPVFQIVMPGFDIQYVPKDVTGDHYVNEIR